MITKSPITLAEARTLCIGTDPVAWTRLLVTFDETSNASNADTPRWVHDGPQTYHLHTFDHVPSPAEVAATLAEVVAAHEALTYVRLRYLEHEICTGSELCAVERRDVEYAGEIPQQYQDTDLLYRSTGPLVGGGPIRPWSPKAYARAVLAARDAALPLMEAA